MLPATVHDQVARLVAVGLADRAGVSAGELAQLADGAPAGALVALHPDVAPASLLAPLVQHRAKEGFVVCDMTDVDAFGPVPGAEPPDAAAYLVTGLDRGDQLSNWRPNEASPAIADAGRTPLTLSEALQWVLQQPDVLARNSCFMTLGSRLRRADGTLDARVPAIWISNGTGRDGAARRGAPKVGWCWAGNRHTWLGFASAERRLAPAPH